ncbi:hypothetical protein Tco_0710571, partial [Tanacetum coccineum]
SNSRFYAYASPHINGFGDRLIQATAYQVGDAGKRVEAKAKLEANRKRHFEHLNIGVQLRRLCGFGNKSSQLLHDSGLPVDSPSSSQRSLKKDRGCNSLQQI